MKQTLKTLLSIGIAVAGTATAFGQSSVLSTGESWSGFDVFEFNDGPGLGLTQVSNSGSNSGAWNINSQDGKFVTDNSGFAVTDGDAGIWARTISYTTAISSGKWRLEFDFGAFDFSTFNNMTGVNDLKLELRDGKTSVASLLFRVHDDDYADGFADRTQVAISSQNAGNENAFSGKIATITSANNADWEYVALEFDFSTGSLFYDRNGITVGGTGDSGKDTGLITFSQFDELRLSANGDWASSTADTGVLNTDLIGLYTAIPEPSTYAMFVGILVIGYVVTRKRLD